MSYEQIDKNQEKAQELSGISFREIAQATIFKAPAAKLCVPDCSELDLTLFVACYNEEENILASLEAVVQAMSGLHFSWEAIIVDDASTDRSVSLVRQYMNDHPDYPLILVAREENQGLAQNFIEAAFLGRGRYYRIINGDNVESSSQMGSILSHIGEADMLLPYHAKIQGRTLFRRGLSRTFTLIVNLLSGYRIRYYNGCSVHLRYDVLRWHVNCSGFDFQANLITRLLGQGRTYIEIPVIGGERAFGYSKALTLKNFFSAARFFMDLAFRRTWKFFHGK
jgi:glycosyltransferase involved in cell wall biosynthesis